MPTEKKHTRGIPLIALFLLSGIFAIHGELFGKTTAGAKAAAGDADSMLTAVSDGPRHYVDPSFMDSIRTSPQRLKPLPPEMLDAETLWLARCIYSETKRTEEMELVGWVVRNRVETAYRDQQSYRDVVLDPYQFSAFNPNSRKRRYYAELAPDDSLPGWQRALHVAHYVRNAAPEYRPFSIHTRHFYSERSMVGRRHPDWARGLRPIELNRKYDIDARRFRFFAGIS